MAEIRTARFADALKLADRLRAEDAREIAVTWGLGTRQGLLHCLLQSDRSFALFEDGEVEALWGISRVLEHGLDIGIPWLLAGERLFDGNRAILGQSRRVIDHLLMDHDLLCNRTDAANAAHLRWLAWCGFEELRRSAVPGVAGRIFVEFYRLNPRRELAPAAALAVLRRRPLPRAELRVEDAVRRLVNVALRLLDDCRGPKPEEMEELAALVPRVHELVISGAHPGKACATLLLEMAGRVCGQGRRHRSLLRQHPVGELLGALDAVADLLALEHPGRDGGLLPLLDHAGRVRPAAPRRQQSERATPPQNAAHGLLRRYLDTLTLNGRVSRVQGARLWAAAAGAGSGIPPQSPGLDRARLLELVRDRWIHDALLADAGGGGAASPSWRQRLVRPVRGTRVLTSLRACGSVGGPLGGALTEQIDRWPAADSAAGPPGRIDHLAGAIGLVSGIADRVALALLPGLRLGGVTSGYADRHWLYRLLRAWLLSAGVCEPDELQGLLRDEVAGLLLAGRLEDRLLAPAQQTSGDEAGVLRELVAGWDPGVGGAAEVAHLVNLIAAALAVPAVHHMQLPPALLAWHLSITGGLPAAVRGVAEVVGNAGTGSRRVYRKRLQVLCRDVNMLTFRRHLQACAGPDEPDPGSLTLEPRTGRGLSPAGQVAAAERSAVRGTTPPRHRPG